MKASEKLEAFPGPPDDATDFIVSGTLGLAQEANHDVKAVIKNYVKLCEMFLYKILSFPDA